MDIKVILKKHALTICASLSLLVCLLPFYSLSVNSDYLELSESYNLFSALSEDFSFRGVLFLALPAALIAMNYLLHIRNRKYFLFAVPIVSLLNALTELIFSTGAIEGSDWFWDSWYANLKPSVGFYLAILTYIGSVVLVILQERGRDSYNIDDAYPSESGDRNGMPSLETAGGALSAIAAKGAEKAMAAMNALRDKDDTPEKRDLRAQIAQRNDQLGRMYADFGRRYIDQFSGQSSAPFQAEESAKRICALREEIRTLEKRVMEIDKRMLNDRIASERIQAMQQFDQEIAKLDKAVAMDVMSREEYDSKRAALQRRMDNFEDIKRIEIQQEMGVISREERDERIAKLVK